MKSALKMIRPGRHSGGRVQTERVATVACAWRKRDEAAWVLCASSLCSVSENCTPVWLLQRLYVMPHYILF